MAKLLMLLVGWAALLLVSSAQELPELNHLRLNQIQVRRLTRQAVAAVVDHVRRGDMS